MNTTKSCLSKLSCEHSTELLQVYNRLPMSYVYIHILFSTGIYYGFCDPTQTSFSKMILFLSPFLVSLAPESAMYITTCSAGLLTVSPYSYHQTLPLPNLVPNHFSVCIFLWSGQCFLPEFHTLCFLNFVQGIDSQICCVLTLSHCLPRSAQFSRSISSIKKPHMFLNEPNLLLPRPHNCIFSFCFLFLSFLFIFERKRGRA